ncbi:DnaJ subfamily C member 13 [Cichlidogyrus casuarinus]|uniref:DnaJ subfamily C member 13 n=1 Tax=Cichlidogyrus casuarinus TaxID=1844966 RepID=A0ABD2QBY1_9PLAT
MKYHPDKNPEGREKFDAVSTAYNLICNRSKISTGPNRLHLQLIIRAQSIIYKRYRLLLAPHKYAGYPMLLKTIKLETEDDNLFARAEANCASGEGTNAVLLADATELVYETVATSALNAEEMRREGGILDLQEAFSRCASMLSPKTTKPEDMIARVCYNVTAFYSVATFFPKCRERIHELPQVVRNVLRLLYHDVSR